MADWAIEALAPDHIRDRFDCGKAPLTEFLRTLAGQYERKEIGKTYVVVRAGERVVAGYYTVAAAGIEPARLPAKASKKLPRHPIGVVLLGRLEFTKRRQADSPQSEQVARGAAPEPAVNTPPATAPSSPHDPPR